MHQIEIGNEVETHRLTIIWASREAVSIDIFGHVEAVTTADYIAFARALTKTYHELDGTAQLVNEAGHAIVTLAFKRGVVDVQIVRDTSIRTFQTDQSYVTTMVRQIGVVE
ncbi:hypothetical protein [Exiguobacterium aurantiacum]|uniref:hypothetical protein n=1 Tax=Exiguobacterium aurantiacum TaxID=33987 RepID=UPI0008777A90|nr:hypothetical protein [Exiguobacterium aurantiacum]